MIRDLELLEERWELPICTSADAHLTSEMREGLC